jgi:hypothetical protein
MSTDRVAPYAPVLIKLLQGVVTYDDTTTWGLLLHHRVLVEDYFARMGLHLRLYEADGYAFLQQPEAEQEQSDRKEPPLPRLTRRDRLSYPITLLLVLLRERLDQFEAATPEADRLFLTQDQLRDLLRPFLSERSDERATQRKSDETVNKVVELGFLKRVAGEGPRYEVRRVLKARIDGAKLAEIKAQMLNVAGLADQMTDDDPPGPD